MKKYALTLIICCLLSLVSRGKQSRDASAGGKEFFIPCLKACIEHYDREVLELLNHARPSGQFLPAYYTLERQYRRQYEWTIRCAGMLPSYDSKSARKAMALLKGDWQSAVDLMGEKLRNEKARSKNADDFRFYAILLSAGGAHKDALKALGRVLSAELGDREDSSLYIALLCGDAEWDRAYDINRQLASAHPSDTFFAAKNALALSRLLRWKGDSAASVAPLVTASYWLQSSRGAEKQLLRASILLDLARLQLAVNDFDNAPVNVKTALSLMEGDKENRLLQAEANTLAGTIYRKAGGNKEAEAYFVKAYDLFHALPDNETEETSPMLVAMLDEYGAVLKWFDKETEYEAKLKESAAIRKKLAQSRYPFFELDYAQNLFVLGQKYMNVDVKISPAEEQWQLAKDVLELLSKRNIMLAGPLLCETYYKLAGCKTAFKMHAEAKAIFQQSLAVREKLYALAPSVFAKDLATVLIQNANFNAIDKEFREAVAKLERAEEKAKEAGDQRMIGEIGQFKEKLKAQIK